MASRTFNDVQALDKAVKLLFGKLVVGAAGAVTSQTSLGFTVTITTTAGEYLVTFADEYPEMLFGNVSSVAGTSEDSTWEIDAYDMSAKTCTIRHCAAGAAAFPTSGNSFLMMFVLKNTSVGP